MRSRDIQKDPRYSRPEIFREIMQRGPEVSRVKETRGNERSREVQRESQRERHRERVRDSKKGRKVNGFQNGSHSSSKIQKTQRMDGECFSTRVTFVF